MSQTVLWQTTWRSRQQLHRAARLSMTFVAPAVGTISHRACAHAPQRPTDGLPLHVTRQGVHGKSRPDDVIDTTG